MKPSLKVRAAPLIKHREDGGEDAFATTQFELGSKIGQQGGGSQREQESTSRLGGQTGGVKNQRSPLSNS